MPSGIDEANNNIAAHLANAALMADLKSSVV